MKRALPALWITFVYVIVVLTEGKAPSPPFWTLERLVYETWHTVLHAGVFAIQVWLMARAVSAGGRNGGQDSAILIGVSTLLGVGIEILQASMRPDYLLLEGLWDVFSDYLGAVAGWKIIRKIGQFERSPVHS